MNIKTENLSQTIPLALQILRGRAAEWYKSFLQTNDTAEYERFSAYDSAATLLCEALDGHLEAIQQWVGDTPLPDIPTSPCQVCSTEDSCMPGTQWAMECTRWVDWNAATRHRVFHASMEPACPCDTCTFKYCPDGRTTGGKLDCADYAEWCCKAGNK